MVSVLPDLPAVDRTFDYLLSPQLARGAAIGSIVRVPLAGRVVRGWIVGWDVQPPAGVRLSEIRKLTGAGPSQEMIELCRWAAWRWGSRHAIFLRMASPDRVVGSIAQRPGQERPGPQRPGPERSGPERSGPADPLMSPRSVLRLPPVDDGFEVALRATRHGDALIICPSVRSATSMARRLRSAGVRTALHPDDWGRAAAGGVTVVGPRSAAFAPMPSLAAVVVVDEHDEALQAEGSPTWHAREVALERARRARVPAVMTSAIPSLEALSRSPLQLVDRRTERLGWPAMIVIDRRDEDLGRTGLLSERLVPLLREPGHVVCVLNTVGRARLLACGSCGTVERCERCDAAVSQIEPGRLRCRRCGLERPEVCQSCGSTTLRLLRQGVSRVAEELSALVGEPVNEISHRTPFDQPASRVVVGTEAALHRSDRADRVIFLEFDQELLAPRYRASEQALGLLARAGRLVGGRRGSVVVQTRHPDHPVLRAAATGDPGPVTEAEDLLRRELDLPPAATLAVIGGPAGPGFLEALVLPDGCVRLEMATQSVVTTHDRPALLDALAATPRPPGRLRLQIDPLRIPQPSPPG